jgi:GNAT superfamily N-acetyltransferase
MALEVRAVREDEREACIDLWCTVWPGEGARAYFGKYFYGDVEWLPYYTQVAVLNGKIVSAVQICKRIVPCGEFRLTMGGIANVATLPEYRGKGYNTECLRRALSVMEADAMDFSLLFTHIHDFYARVGYSTVGRSSLVGTIREDFTPGETRYAVREAKPEDLPAIRAVYDAYNYLRPIAVQRYEAYWREWLGITPDNLPEGLRVAEDSAGQICGYIQPGLFRSAVPYNETEVERRIIEMGILPGETEAEITTALLEAMATHFLQNGLRRMRLDIAFEPAVMAALESLLESWDWERSDSAMVRLLHRTNLLQSLTMQFQERWIAAGRPGGVLTIDTPYGATRLDATGAFLKVDAADEPHPLLSQAQFFELLSGAVAPAQVTANSALYPLLNALFPRRAPVFWGGDGF